MTRSGNPVLFIEMDAETKIRLREQAHRQRTSMSAYVLQLLRADLDRAEQAEHAEGSFWKYRLTRR